MLLLMINIVMMLTVMIMLTMMMMIVLTMMMTVMMMVVVVVVTLATTMTILPMMGTGNLTSSVPVALLHVTCRPSTSAWPWEASPMS